MKENMKKMKEIIKERKIDKKALIEKGCLIIAIATLALTCAFSQPITRQELQAPPQREEVSLTSDELLEKLGAKSESAKEIKEEVKEINAKTLISKLNVQGEKEGKKVEEREGKKVEIKEASLSNRQSISQSPSVEKKKEVKEEVKASAPGNTSNASSKAPNTPSKAPSISNNAPSKAPSPSNNSPSTQPSQGDSARPQAPQAPQERPQPCTSHNMIKVNSTIDSQQQLYQYVTTNYKCSKCGHASSETHKTPAQLSYGDKMAIANSIVANVNQLRAQQGLSQLWTSGAWNNWADTRAHELESFYGHARPDGSSWVYGIGNQYTIGENVASGQASGYDFFQAFNNSNAHRDNMLAPEAKGIGVSIHVANDGTSYCAMVLIGE